MDCHQRTQSCRLIRIFEQMLRQISTPVVGSFDTGISDYPFKSVESQNSRKPRVTKKGYRKSVPLIAWTDLRPLS